MLRFVAADLRRQWPGVMAIALIIALATALGVAVTLGERALRLGTARAAGAFDLVIGAPGSETQLLLSSVFLQPAPLPLMPGHVLAGLLSDPRVAVAAPIGFGDFAGDAPIVGTTGELVARFGGVTEGRSFERLGEAVVGAGAAPRVGDVLTPLHGRLAEGGHPHAAVRYRVVGRMAPTRTAWDRAVFVPIEAVWAVHAGEAEDHGGAGKHGEGEARNPRIRLHDAPVDLDAPIRPEALADPHAPGLPAILVKPRTIADAYKLRAQYRNNRTLAIFPGEVLTRLYGTLGDVRTILSLVAGGAQALVAAATLLVVVVHVLQRRRQIGALRAFGAPRAVVFATVWLEAFLMVGAGVLVGFGIGYITVRALSDVMSRSSGFELPVEFHLSDMALLAGLLAVTGAVSLVPAMLAYRQSPAAALRG